MFALCRVSARWQSNEEQGWGGGGGFYEINTELLTGR